MITSPARLYLVLPEVEVLPFLLKACTPAGEALMRLALSNQPSPVPGAPGVTCRLNVMHDLALVHYYPAVQGEIAAEAAVTWQAHEDTRTVWSFLCENLTPEDSTWNSPPPAEWYWAGIVLQPSRLILPRTARTAIIRHFSLLAPAVLGRTLSNN